jgi:hypothetical protein
MASKNGTECVHRTPFIAPVRRKSNAVVAILHKLPSNAKAFLRVRNDLIELVEKFLLEEWNELVVMGLRENYCGEKDSSLACGKPPAPDYSLSVKPSDAACTLG